MRILTKIVWAIETLKVIERHGYDYAGPIAFAKASSQETAIGAQQQQFFSTLMSDYNQQFANQSGILKGITASFQPILNAGINQQGFSPSELASFKTAATDQTSAEYQKAAVATGEKMAAAGGGNTYLPKGVDSAVQANIAAQAAGKESSMNLAIDEANYTQGRSNFLDAATALGGVAQQYTPTGYAGSANAAGGTAFNSANAIATQNDTFGQVAGLLGGVAGSFVGGIGKGVGQKIAGVD